MTAGQPLEQYSMEELAEALLHQTIDPTVLDALVQRCIDDKTFEAELNETIDFISLLNQSGQYHALKSQLEDLRQSNDPNRLSAQNVEAALRRWKPSWLNTWRTAAIAAGIAVLTSLTTVMVMRNISNQTKAQYTVLKKEIDRVKNSQKQIISNIKDQQNATPTLPQESMSGTGFALTNNGYVITNCHVIEGADSIYIQTSSGQYHKADLVVSNKVTDVALLKIRTPKFQFAKEDVPYKLADKKLGLGSKVYTLGYPQEEIVYNEGYISAINGFMGDSSQYRLVLPANPGQSGAPVVDQNGLLIGMIAGKDTQSSGATFAVTATVISELINTLPEEEQKQILKAHKSTRLKFGSKADQVQLLSQYTCKVKTF